MKTLPHLFENNRAWARAISTRDPDFFSKLSRQQAPQYLWIGCSDSRVPANEIVGLLPGEMFVHRNVANVVVHTDLNCLSVIQYAVDVLKITDIMVVGHYGCGGVIAALEQRPLGLIDNWLRHVQDVMRRHETLLGPLADPASRARLLCELNVIDQVANVCHTSIVQEAWNRGRQLAVHGWCYGLANGLLKDLEMRVGPEDELGTAYRRAVDCAAARERG
jgi:carbonic anhydrase